MDLATVLARVDARRYCTVAAYMRDVAAIVTASQQYWGDAPEYCRELSRAHELHDEAQALLLERLPQQLVERWGQCLGSRHAGRGGGLVQLLWACHG
jgi:hypothetical protein